MKFLYRSDRKKAKYHIANDEGKSLCLMENGDHFQFQYLLTNTPPHGRRLCAMCGYAQFNPSKFPPRVPPKKPIPRNRSKFSAFYRSPEWKRLRYDRLEASQGKCECCGASSHEGTVLNVDHIKPLKTHWHLRLDFDNTQVLCASCNEGKGNRYTTRWR